MKQIIFAVTTLFLSSSIHAGNFIISIDGYSSEIELNQPLKYMSSDGKELKIILKKKDNSNYKSQLFSMTHKSALSTTSTDIGDNTLQTFLNSPVGTAIIIQEYLDTNPEKLVELLLHKITKKDVDQGYKYSEKGVTKTIDGRKISGKQAITSHPNREWKRSVYAYGGDSKGIIIVTMIERGEYENGEYIISDFWNSLKLSFD